MHTYTLTQKSCNLNMHESSRFCCALNNERRVGKLHSETGHAGVIANDCIKGMQIKIMRECCEERITG